jgi:predicted nucleotidyltransferase
MALDITPAQLALVQSILQKHLPAIAKVWVFGSRANGKSRPSSDLDLAIDAGRKLSLHDTAKLTDDFDEAPLPFSVDILDLHSVSPEFLGLVESDFRPFPGFEQVNQNNAQTH